MPVISVWDGDKSETVQFDVFFKHCPEQPLRVPCSVEVLSCYVPVSQKYILCEQKNNVIDYCAMGVLFYTAGF